MFFSSGFLMYFFLSLSHLPFSLYMLLLYEMVFFLSKTLNSPEPQKTPSGQMLLGFSGFVVAHLCSLIYPGKSRKGKKESAPWHKVPLYKKRVSFEHLYDFHWHLSTKKNNPPWFFRFYWNKSFNGKLFFSTFQWLLFLHSNNKDLWKWWLPANETRPFYPLTTPLYLG